MNSDLRQGVAAGKFLCDPYMDWARGEGLPIHEGFGVDVIAAETSAWDRYDAKGALIHVKGRGDYVSCYSLEIPPGRRTAPQRHLFEEIVYVLEGRGSTTIESGDGRRFTFEWGPKSMFALPLNARYQHFNGSGRERALLACTHDLPVMLNLIHNTEFIFNCSFDFADRLGSAKYFDGDGDYIEIRPGRNMWETNFVPDLTSFELVTWNARGAGSANICFVLADGTMHAHVSEIPARRYKKGHRHVDGFHIFAVTGSGYSLLWYEGDQDFHRLPWRHGIMYAPPLAMYHQHFNTSSSAARYLAIGLGSRRYPFTNEHRRDIEVGTDTSAKKGGIQVEYEDQDPRIHKLWLKEMASAGLRSDMGDVIDESLYV